MDVHRAKVSSFTDLVAWQKGHALVIEIYTKTKSFPKEEIFGLTSQLRRCAVSITSNLAEGFSRKGKKEKSQFYHNALGSLTELQNQILVARDVGYIKPTEFSLLGERSIVVSKLINGLIKSSMDHSLNT